MARKKKKPKTTELIRIYVQTFTANEERWKKRQEEIKRSEFPWLSDKEAEMFTLQELRRRFKKGR